jgi:hypothetical protein
MIMDSKNYKTDFHDWLKSTDNTVFEAISMNYFIQIIKIRKSDDFDYLYCQRIYLAAGVQRGGKFEYSGIYFKRDGLLYDSHELWGLYDSADTRNKNGLKESLKYTVCKAVEAAINNDRRNLRITELTDERELREITEYFPKYSAPSKAREAYLSGDYDDGGYHYNFICNYNSPEWTEDSLLEYILDPQKYAENEAEAYIERTQELILADFLKADMIEIEYQKILDNPDNSAHSVKRIIRAIKDTPAKTVTVSIHKDDIELTFKAEADQFRKDCISNYSDYDIVASDRREFQRIFGRNAHFTPEEIIKIEYARNVLYQAEDKSE